MSNRLKLNIKPNPQLSLNLDFMTGVQYLFIIKFKNYGFLL